MSGPTTVIVTAEPVTTLLAAAAIHAAAAVRAGYEEAAAITEAQAGKGAAQRAEMQAAHRAGQAAMAAEAAAAETRIGELLALANRLGAKCPAGSMPPRPDSVGLLGAWLGAAQKTIAELEDILRTEAARHRETASEAEVDFALPASASADATGALSQRWLDRIRHLGPLPEEIARLARELDGTPPGERADLLTGELRRHIQLQAEAAQQRAVQVATGVVIAQTLKDLGYQIEEIAETLFVDGGVTHFRRPGWGDHMVRLRADAQAGSINFNVVRAVDGQANERSVLDHLAEDRWCAEFPTLMQALAARGVSLAVTRRLEAGELPVQLVARDRLPRFAEEEAGAPAAQPKAREMK